MNTEMDERRDSSLRKFTRKVEEVQDRISDLSGGKGKRFPTQERQSAQLHEELQLLMEELHVAAEELQQQNEELVEARIDVEKQRQKYQDLFHFAPDGYLVTDENGMILEANKAASRLFNEQLQLLIHKPLAQYVAREFRKDFRKKLNQLLRISSIPDDRIEDWEFTLLSRSGELVEVSASVTPIVCDLSLREKENSYRWLIRDVRAQKRLQEEMRETKNELLKSRQRERQKLARNLHDGPVQDLHGIIFQLKPLENEISHPRIKNNLDVIETQLIDIVRKLRLICSDLRPPTLIPFGLEKAIRSHAGTFREMHPEIDVFLELMPDDLPNLKEEERLVFFQVYQQAMANVLRHSDANRVWVRLREDNGKICMEVEDNGNGFEVPNKWIKLIRQHHYGLADTVEQAESIGGTLEVDSSPGKGTVVRVSLHQEQAEE